MAEQFTLTKAERSALDIQIRRWIVDNIHSKIEPICDHSWRTIYQKNNRSYFTALCDKYGSDKGSLNNNENGIYPWAAHTYADFYEMMFSHCRMYIEDVLECGIGTNNPQLPSSMGEKGRPGASLRTWQDYFPKAQIIGIDVDENILFSDERIKTYAVDQTSTKSITSFLTNIGERYFDIIIDDGLHEHHAGVTLFEACSSRLRQNGVYIIEDVILQDIERYVRYFSQKPSWSFLIVELFRPGKTYADHLIIIRHKEDF